MVAAVPVIGFTTALKLVGDARKHLASGSNSWTSRPCSAAVDGATRFEPRCELCGQTLEYDGVAAIRLDVALQPFFVM